jgi:hypothetical protein
LPGQPVARGQNSQNDHQYSKTEAEQTDAAMQR